MRLCSCLSFGLSLLALVGCATIPACGQAVPMIMYEYRFMSIAPLFQDNSPGSREFPGGAVGSEEEGVGGVVVEDAFGLGVPFDAGFRAQGDVAELGDGGDVVADFEVFDGLGAGFHAI